jgi:hypothetical protein
VFVVRGETYGEFDLPAVRNFIRIFAPRRGEIVVDAEALDLTPPPPKRPRGRRSSRGVVPATGDATPIDDVRPTEPEAEPDATAGDEAAEGS